MLHELRVENLLLMQRAELRLGPGLNVLTGETGAGKTLLAHALDLLLGGRARRGIVRPGAGEAWVEGVFDLPADLAGDERIPDGATELVLARRVWPDGRTRAYVGGRAAIQADLAQLGGRLLSFYGQHEHRRLMLSTAQLDLLDAFCGEGQARLRGRMHDAHERVRSLEDRAASLRELAGSRERELDLVRYELSEIEAADPSAGEQEALLAERDRLRHHGELTAAAAEGVQALAPEAGEGVAELAAAAAGRLRDAAELDGALTPLADRLLALQYEAADVGAELRDYLLALAADGGEDAAGRLQATEERLALLSRLERKHGGSLAEVAAHAERCRAREAELTGAESDLEAVDAELAQARAAREEIAGRLRRARGRAAPRLAREVRVRLGELAMEQARFEIALHDREDGCGPRGADAIEMQIAANGGSREALAPLREVASGGELSRVMLALLSVAHGSGETDADGGMLVFDEIDAGIGGHTARAVGEHLRALAAGRQVLCITHLPQVAALGERHFTIVKDARSRPATTTVTALSGDAVVDELVRMMGAADTDTAAAGHARELVAASRP